MKRQKPSASKYFFAQKKYLFIYVILLIPVIFIYYQVLFYDYVHLDDDRFILNRIEYLSDYKNIPESFTTIIDSQKDIIYYRPLFTLSFFTDTILFGASSFHYHLTNIMLFYLCVCLLFKFFIQLGFNKKETLLSVILFSVLPVFTSVSGWIVGRTESILFIFTISSLLFFIRYLRYGDKKYLFIHCLFFVFALLSKENAIFIPFIAIAIINAKQEFKKIFLKNKILVSTLWISIVLIWSAISYIITKRFSGIEFHNVLESILTFMQYFGKIFFPFNLSVLPITPDTSNLYWIISLMFFALIFLLFTKNIDLKNILLGFLIFILFLFPALFTLYDVNLEARLMLPAAGIFIILLSSGIFNKIFQRKVFLSFFTALIIFYSYLSIRNLDNYKDQFNFWSNAAATSPNYAFAQAGLGKYYHSKNDLEKAEQYYLKALEVSFNELWVRSFLGHIRMMEDKYDEALALLDYENSINLKCANCYFYKGWIYFEKNNVDLAEKNWLTALKMDPNNKQYCEFLVMLYYKTGNIKEAQRLEKLTPGN